MFLRMDLSLDDLLNEVEGAMMEDSSTCREGIPSAANTSEWSHPPVFIPPPDPFEATKQEQQQNRENAATSLPAAAAASSNILATIVGIANAPEVLFVPTDYDASVDDVDELLRVVPAVHETSSAGPLRHCEGRERSDGTKQVAGDIAGAGFDDDVVVLASSGATATTRAGQQYRHSENDWASAVSASQATDPKKKRRCGTVCLAGTAIGKGFCASSISRRACDALRCTDCNFEVLCFDGSAWGEDTNYIFLRNNAPDPVKLSARLQPSSDTSAYACQCSWRSVVELCILAPTERPRWVCGGH